MLQIEKDEIVFYNHAFARPETFPVKLGCSSHAGLLAADVTRSKAQVATLLSYLAEYLRPLDRQTA